MVSFACKIAHLFVCLCVSPWLCICIGHLNMTVLLFCVDFFVRWCCGWCSGRCCCFCCCHFCCYSYCGRCDCCRLFSLLLLSIKDDVGNNPPSSTQNKHKINAKCRWMSTMWYLQICAKKKKIIQAITFKWHWRTNMKLLIGA